MFAKNLRLKAFVAMVLTAILLTLVGTAALPESQARPLFQPPLFMLPKSLSSSSFEFPLPTPLPSSTPCLTISPDLSNSERALRFVAQRQGIPQDWLILADFSTIELPLTGVKLWRGVVLDWERRGQLLHEVIVDTGTGEALNSRKVEVLWETERVAHRLMGSTMTFMDHQEEKA